MDPFGSTIFCDDIRFEQFNKISLIGMYGYELVNLRPFPLVLPKLGFYISVRFPHNHKVSGPRLLMYFPGDQLEAPTHTINLPWESDGSMTNPDPAEFPDPSDFYGFNLPYLLNSVAIKQPGFLRLRIQDGEKRIKVGALQIREATAEEAVAFQAAQSKI